MSVLTLPHRGTSRLGEYKCDPSSEDTSHHQKIVFCLRGEIPSSGVWLDERRNRLRVAAYPIVVGFSWLPPSGGTSHHRGTWLDVCHNCLYVGAHPIRGVFTWLPPSRGTSHHRGAWVDVCRNRLRVSAHPIHGGFYWPPLSGDVPSAWHMDGRLCCKM